MPISEEAKRLNDERKKREMDRYAEHVERDREYYAAQGMQDPTDAYLLEAAEAKIARDNPPGPPQVPDTSLEFEADVRSRSPEEQAEITTKAMHLLAEGWDAESIRTVVRIDADLQDIKHGLASVADLSPASPPQPVETREEKELVSRYSWLHKQQISDPAIRQEMSDIAEKLKDLE